MSLPKAAERCYIEFEKAFAAFMDQRYNSANDLHAAIRYALDGRGKRVRPILALLSCEAAGGTLSAAMPAAIAVEMIHTYSLVHDDLPCMDNDDLRRGRPTAHKAFNEALALLAGDALLTDAFALLSTMSETGMVKPNAALAMIQVLAEAAGGRGMVQGQALDLYWTARQDAASHTLDEIHLQKTGRLLGAACAMGALAAGSETQTTAHFRRFGELIGLAFQIIDDLLDDTPNIGKSPGKDRAAGKLTYLTTLSRDKAQETAASLTKEAIELLQPYGGAESLITFGESLLGRVF